MKFLMLTVAVIATALSVNGMSIGLDGVASEAEQPRFVYISDYNQAETHLIMASTIASIGGIGKLLHARNVTPIRGPNQPQVVRMNRDTLYSYGVYDLTASVTFELPPSNGFYMSLYALDEDQFSVATVYTDKTRSTIVTYSYNPRARSSSEERDSDEKSKNKPIKVKVVSKTRYIYTIIRTLANPTDLADLTRAQALQTAVTTSQASAGQLVIPKWNLASLSKLRSALIPLTNFVQPSTSLNGKRGSIGETTHLIGTAALWGGLPIQDAAYNIYYPPASATSSSVFSITVGDVPIASTAFWSISVYNASGLLQFNPYDSYSQNSLTAIPEADGTRIIYFSSVRTENMKNWIFTFPGWNYMVRMYQPSKAIINNQFSFPSLVQVV